MNKKIVNLCVCGFLLTCSSDQKFVYQKSLVQRESFMEKSILGVDKLDKDKIKTKEIIPLDKELLKSDEIKLFGTDLNYKQIVEQIDNSLNSSLNGYGDVFVDKALEYDVDPYLAVSIMLHETGCAWTCSSLVRNNNNIGGMRGNGNYYTFSSLEEGIDAYYRNLSNNYVSKGLDTPEEMVYKYTGFNNDNWLSKVKSYIKTIKSK